MLPGWDRAQGTVRLPIDVAIDVIAERGLPHVTTLPPAEMTAHGLYADDGRPPTDQPTARHAPAAAGDGHQQHRTALGGGRPAVRRRDAGAADRHAGEIRRGAGRRRRLARRPVGRSGSSHRASDQSRRRPEAGPDAERAHLAGRWRQAGRRPAVAAVAAGRAARVARLAVIILAGLAIVAGGAGLRPLAAQSLEPVQYDSRGGAGSAAGLAEWRAQPLSAPRLRPEGRPAPAGGSRLPRRGRAAR